MRNVFIKFLTFGEQYVIASMVYIGVALMLLSTIPEVSHTFANENSGCGPCEEAVEREDENGTYTECVYKCNGGQICCDNECKTPCGGECPLPNHECCYNQQYLKTPECCCDDESKAPICEPIE